MTALLKDGTMTYSTGRILICTTNNYFSKWSVKVFNLRLDFQFPILAVWVGGSLGLM